MAAVSRPWERGEVFTPSSAAEFEEYRAWARRVPCSKCGREKANDVDANGKPQMWLTETDCGRCGENNGRG